MSALAEESFAATWEPAWSLLDQHSADFLRLQRILQSRPSFKLILCQFNAPLYRDRVIAQVNATLPSPGVWVLPADPDAALFEAELAAQSIGHDCLHLIELDQWLAKDQEGVLRLFNYHRERIVELAPVPLLLWVSPAQVTPFARQAPDMWAWRTAVLDFTLPAQAQRKRSVGERLSLGRAGAGEIKQRIAEITKYLADRPQPSNADANLLLEAADAAARLGDWTESQAYAGRALTIYQVANNRRGVAAAQGRIANVLRAQGKLDEALRILREQQLPIYERLGDTHRRALTLGEIAGILMIQGEWDEALRIRRNLELPIYKALGDEHGEASALGRIADILEMRGNVNEARRIHQEEVLPLFERLGSIRDQAITLAKIADTNTKSGNLAEALHTLRDRVVPIFSHLGDLQSRAVASCQIANILAASGNFEEALHVYRHDALSTYERLGDERGRALALLGIAGILKLREEWDEALRISRDEALPIFDRVGDAVGQILCQYNIADLLLARAARDSDDTADRAIAHALLCESLAKARYLDIPAVILELESIVARHGLHCPEA